MARDRYSAIENPMTAREVSSPTLRPTNMPVTNGRPNRRVVSRLGPSNGNKRFWRLRYTAATAMDRARPQMRVAPVRPWMAGMKKSSSEYMEKVDPVSNKMP